MAVIIRKPGKHNAKPSDLTVRANTIVNEAYILGIMDGREHTKLHKRLFGVDMAAQDMQECVESAERTLKVCRLSGEVAAHTRGFRDFFKNQMKKLQQAPAHKAKAA